jgi:glycerate kinase
MVFAGAKIRSGIDTILNINGFDRLVSEADLVISGEGNLDGQSIFGKVPVGVAKRAQENGKPVIVIAGGIGRDIRHVFEYGIDSIMSSTCRPMGVNEAIDQWTELLADAAERVMRMIRLGMNLNP